MAKDPATSLQDEVVVAEEVVVSVSVVQAEVTWLHVQEPQRVLVTPQLTLQRSVQDRPEHRLAQSDWALKNRQHRPLEYEDI